jgi:hypothetical protein
MLFAIACHNRPPFTFPNSRRTSAGCAETHATHLPLHRWCLLLALILAIALASHASAQNSATLAWDPNPEADIAGYVVYFGTATGTYPTIQDVGNVTTHTFSGLSSTTTYYCAVQSYNSDGLMSDLSSEISFNLQAATVSFSNWASTGGLTGTAATPSAIPFHDGVRNLLKYAFNMNPAGPDARTLTKGTGTAGLPAFTLDRSGAQPQFTVEFLRRKSGGVTYTPKTSTNFTTYVTMTGTTTVTSIDANWERVVIQKPVSTSTTPRIFGIVEVTQP